MRRNRVNRPRWWQLLTILVTVALGIPPLTAAPPAAEGRPELPAHDFRTAPEHAVIRVASGDTVIVRTGDTSRQIGLLGVKAPPGGTAHGREALRLLENMLAGETVYIEYPLTAAQPDETGRYPAYLYRAPDGLFVNLELVRHGLAEFADAPTLEYRELFRYYETRAKELRKGQWAPPPVKADTRKPDKQAGRQPQAGKSDAPAGKGSTQAGKDDTPAAQDGRVYVTPQGKKYHRANCAHLGKNTQSLSLQEAKTRGFTPCSKCKPPP